MVDVLENISPHVLKWSHPLLSDKSHCASMRMWKWENRNMSIQIVKATQRNPHTTIGTLIVTKRHNTEISTTVQISKINKWTKRIE